MRDDIHYREIEIILKAIIQRVGEFYVSDKTYMDLANNEKKIHIEYVRENKAHKVYLN